VTPATETPASLPPTKVPEPIEAPATKVVAIPTPEPTLVPEPTLALEPTVAPELPATPSPTPAPPENPAPLFTLPNAADGEQISLESYRGDRDVVLVFYRGFW
jgi:hypothetical protein